MNSESYAATRYFLEQVTVKRPYVTLELAILAVLNAKKSTKQSDGRMRHWASVTDPRDSTVRTLRVVTLADGKTIHNAFFDRDYIDE
ncbi:MAG: hypothetical protein AAB680_01345 [Pseudomonadota bacterium]